MGGCLKLSSFMWQSGNIYPKSYLKHVNAFFFFFFLNNITFLSFLQVQVEGLYKHMEETDFKHKNYRQVL